MREPDEAALTGEDSSRSCDPDPELDPHLLSYAPGNYFFALAHIAGSPSKKEDKKGMRRNPGTQEEEGQEGRRREIRFLPGLASQEVLAGRS
jgi:hypothetical protein